MTKKSITVKNIILFLFAMFFISIFFGCSQNVTIKQDGSFYIYKQGEKKPTTLTSFPKGSKIVYKIKEEVKSMLEKSGEIILYIDENGKKLAPALQFPLTLNENMFLKVVKGSQEKYKKVNIKDHTKEQKIEIYEIKENNEEEIIKTITSINDNNYYFYGVTSKKYRLRAKDGSLIKLYKKDNQTTNFVDKFKEYLEITITDNTDFEFFENSFEQINFNVDITYPEHSLQVDGIKQKYQKGDKINFQCLDSLEVLEEYQLNNSLIRCGKNNFFIEVNKDLNIIISKNDIKKYEIDSLEKDFYILKNNKQDKQITFIYKNFNKKLVKFEIQEKTILPENNQIFVLNYLDKPFNYKILEEDIKDYTDIVFENCEKTTSDVITYDSPNAYVFDFIETDDKVYNINKIDTQTKITFKESGTVRFKVIIGTTVKNIKVDIDYNFKITKSDLINFLVKDFTNVYSNKKGVTLPKLKTLINAGDDEKTITILDKNNTLKPFLDFEIKNIVTNDILEKDKDYEFNFANYEIIFKNNELENKEYSVVIKYRKNKVFENKITFNNLGENIKTIDELKQFLNNDKTISYLTNNLVVDEKLEVTLLKNKVINGNGFKLSFIKDGCLNLKSDSYKKLEIKNLGFAIDDLKNTNNIISLENIKTNFNNLYFISNKRFLKLKNPSGELEKLVFKTTSQDAKWCLEIDYDNTNLDFNMSNLDFKDYNSLSEYIKIRYEDNMKLGENKIKINDIFYNHQKQNHDAKEYDVLLSRIDERYKNKYLKNNLMQCILKIENVKKSDILKLYFKDKQLTFGLYNKETLIENEDKENLKNNILLSPFEILKISESITNSTFSTFKEYYENYLSNIHLNFPPNENRLLEIDKLDSYTKYFFIPIEF